MSQVQIEIVAVEVSTESCKQDVSNESVVDQDFLAENDAEVSSSSNEDINASVVDNEEVDQEELERDRMVDDMIIKAVTKPTEKKDVVEDEIRKK